MSLTQLLQVILNARITPVSSSHHYREWRVCVSSPCPVLSSSGSGITWADRLCARHKLGYQFGQWLSFVRSVYKNQKKEDTNKKN